MRFKLLFTLILCCSSLMAQNVKIINKTGTTLKECSWVTERDTGRHNAGYKGSIWNKTQYKSPDLVFNKKDFDGKIKFANSGKHTLAFTGDNDSIYYRWNVEINRNTKKLIVDESYMRIHKSALDPKEYVDDVFRTDLYFKFINKTSYKIYACFPWLSDESKERDDIFFYNPDSRLDPGEERAIVVVSERTYNSYLNGVRLQFRYIGTDENGNMVSFYQDDVTSAADDDVVITPENIKPLKMNQIPPYSK